VEDESNWLKRFWEEGSQMPMWEPEREKKAKAKRKGRGGRGRRREISTRTREGETKRWKRERSNTHQAGSKTDHPTPADPSAKD